MKQWLLTGFLATACIFRAHGQAADFWINDGTIISPPDIVPQIDATTFINNNLINITYGVGGIDDRPLFDTSSTLNFTNFGTMTVDTGFRFDTEPANLGVAHWAANFHNNGILNSGLNNFGGFLGAGFPSTTYIRATNLVDPGTINMGFESLLQLTGKDVDLSRSLITMEDTGTAGGFFNVGYVDGYWGVGTNDMTPAFQFEIPPPLSPPSLVTNRAGFLQFQILGNTNFFSYLSDVTDASGSNRFVRAVFLENTNVNFNVEVFFPDTGEIEVKWSPLAGPTNFLYLIDDFGIRTNLQVAFNGFAGGFFTFMPVNYTLAVLPFDIPLGTAETITPIPPGTFDSQEFTNEYSAYEALFLSTTRPTTDAPEGNITNTPGRVEITATDYLDLSLARITANNLIQIKATNEFGGSLGSTLKSPFYNLDLRVTNGFFALTNVLQPSIPKPEGTIELWSGRWTNIVNGITNQFHVLFVDSLLSDTTPTREQDVRVRVNNSFGGSDNLVINDVLNVTGELLLDATSITIAKNDTNALTSTGEINFLSTAILWPTSTPRLQYLTNDGVFTAGNAVFFGGSRANPYYSSTFNEPYKAFVNSGVVTNFGSVIWADYFQDSGVFEADARGSFLLQQSQTAIITNAIILATGGDVLLAGNSLTLSNDVILAGRSISIAATNFLDDGSLTSGSAAGIAGKNGWSSTSFNILTTPSLGSLLGTSVTNTALAFQRVIDRFAGVDKGCNPEGFYNNAAIGRLVLNGDTNSLFEFAPVFGGNAIYIDSLELQGWTATAIDALTNFTGLFVEPNMKVYFGQALAEGVNVSSDLNGKSGGRFCWVSSFHCGFFSSTNLSGCTPPAIVVGGGTNSNSNSNGGGSNGGSNAAYGQGKSVLQTPSVRNTVSSEVMPNGLALAKGTYNGLFYQSTGVASQSAGSINAKVNPTGTYTAKLAQGGRTYSFSGKFDAQGLANATVARAGSTPLHVALHLDLAGGDVLQGTVSDGNWTADLSADRQTYSKTGQACPQAGVYTFAIAGDPATSSTSPGGSSFGTLKVDASGAAVLSATLADGTKVTQSTTISKQGLWPMYASFNSGKGTLMSWMQFANQSKSDLNGQVVWLKSAGAAKNYTGGFTNAISASGAVYRAPSPGSRVLGLTQGSVILSGGGLAQPLSSNFLLGLNNKVTSTSPNSLNLSFVTSTGMFKGTVLNAATGKSISVQGVLSRKANAGAGYFIGDDNTSGQVFIGNAQ